MLIRNSSGAWAFAQLPVGSGALVPAVPARNQIPSVPNGSGPASIPDRSSSLGTARSGSVFSRKGFTALRADQ